MKLRQPTPDAGSVSMPKDKKTITRMMKVAQEIVMREDKKLLEELAKH